MECFPLRWQPDGWKGHIFGAISGKGGGGEKRVKGPQTHSEILTPFLPKLHRKWTEPTRSFGTSAVQPELEEGEIALNPTPPKKSTHFWWSASLPPLFSKMWAIHCIQKGVSYRTMIPSSLPTFFAPSLHANRRLETKWGWEGSRGGFFEKGGCRSKCILHRDFVCTFFLIRNFRFIQKG